MKLSKQRKLIGILAQEMKQGEVGDLLAASTSFSQKEKEECQTPIKFLSALRRKMCTEAAFIAELVRLFGVCNFTHFVKTTEDLARGSPDAHCPKPHPLKEGQASNHDRSVRFRSALVKMSHTITEKDLEIMVALAPIPEGSKEDIHFGFELFEQLERHGCIGENDVELLQEMFELLHLAKAKQLLFEYTTSAHAPLEPPPSQCPLGHTAQMTETSDQPSIYWRKSSSFMSTVTSTVCSLLQSKPTSKIQSEVRRKRNRECALDETASTPPAKVSHLGGSESVETQAPQIIIAENIHITCLLPAASHHQNLLGQQAAYT